MIQFTTSKAIATEFQSAIQQGIAILPPEGGWTRDALLQLAGSALSSACDVTADVGEQWEHVEAKGASLSRDVWAALQFAHAFAAAVNLDAVDTGAEMRVKCGIDEEGNRRIIPVSGLTDDVASQIANAIDRAASQQADNVKRKLKGDGE